MSRENVERVRDIYAIGLTPEAVDRAFRDHLTADFELHIPSVYPDAERYRGRDGIRRWALMISDTWGEWRFEPQSFSAEDDRVCVTVRIVATGGSSGVQLDRVVAHVWRVRDGRAARVDVYLDPAEALEAVRVRE